MGDNASYRPTQLQAKILSEEEVKEILGENVVAIGPKGSPKRPTKKLRSIPLPNLSWADKEVPIQEMIQKEVRSSYKRDLEVFRKCSHVTPLLRTSLIQWMNWYCAYSKCNRSLFYYAVDYMDRYLSYNPDVSRDRLRVISIVCYFMALKMEDIYHITLHEIIRNARLRCPVEVVEKEELHVIQTLNWNLCSVTVEDWMQLYLQLLYTRNKKCDILIPRFSKISALRTSLILNLCSMDEDFFSYNYSVLAAAAVCYTFNKVDALYVSGYKWGDIEKCYTWMEPFAEVCRKQKIPRLSQEVWGRAHELHCVPVKKKTWEMCLRLKRENEEKRMASGDARRIAGRPELESQSTSFSSENSWT